MLRTFAGFIRFIGNYRYYRGNGLNSKTAWDLANRTLPYPAKNSTQRAR
jgi:hypothetical protein